jgi:hypothetical protein
MPLPTDAYPQAPQPPQPPQPTEAYALPTDAYPQAPQPQAEAPIPPQPGVYPPPQTGVYPQPQPGVYPPPPAPEPEDTTPANFQLGTKLPNELNVKVPKNELNFDEAYFIRLLAGSISLSKDEKKRIVESLPKLKQGQVDELIRIFEEEKQKFAALSKKHVPQLEKLAQQHYNEWMDLEAENVQSQKKEEDMDKADEIRKNLGL